MDAVLETYPAAGRVFQAVETDRLEGASVIQLYGPTGCLKKDTASEAARMLGLPVVHIGWMDLRMRADRVLNTLASRRADGIKRAVTISVHDGFMQRERLLGLLEYTEANTFFVLSTSRLQLASVDFPMYPLSQTDLEEMLKRLSKKCMWAYHKDMVNPVYRYTDGVPAKVVHVVRASQNEKTAARVVRMIEDRKETRVADKLYGVLTQAVSLQFVEIAKAINDALLEVGWVELAEHIQERIRTDILSGVAMNDSQLRDGGWKILEDFNPVSKNTFISGCFRIATAARSL